MIQISRDTNIGVLDYPMVTDATKHPEELLDFLSAAEGIAMVNGNLAFLGMAPTITPQVLDSIERSIPLKLRNWRTELIDVVLGTHRAIKLGKRRNNWLFTTHSAQQGTHPVIAQYHASTLWHHVAAAATQSRHGVHTVIEIGTGAALDTYALACQGFEVSSYESDIVTAIVAEANLLHAGLDRARVYRERWTSQNMSLASAVWADPSRRRVGGVRLRRSNEYQPSLGDVFSAKACRHSVVGVKVGPADTVVAGLPAGTHSEYIGFGTECRERILWYNTNNNEGTTATLVDADGTVYRLSDEDFYPALPTTSVGPIGNLDANQDVNLADGIVVEPHPAVIAAGLVTQLFTGVGATPIDPHIAYGITRSEPPASKFYERFRVLCAIKGVRVKAIKQRLHELGWSNATEIKKRGWNGKPEELRSALKLPPASAANANGVVIITRIGNNHLTILCERIV